MILLKVPLEYFADGGESGKPFWDPERAVQAEFLNCFLAGFPVNRMDEIQREVATLAPMAEYGWGAGVIV